MPSGYYVRTAEHKAAISRSKIGRKRKPEHMAACMAAGHAASRGPRSAEFCRKTSEGAKRAWDNGRIGWNYEPDREALRTRQRIRKFIDRYVPRLLGKTEGLRHAADVLGYNRQQLMEHLEARFKPGMNWQNYGAWEIDHIRPVAQFVKEGITDPAIVCALSNLQPLWRRENRRKNASVA